MQPLDIHARVAPSIVARLVSGRGLRGLADGSVSVVLAVDLTRRGYSEGEVGAVISSTLLGSALLTLATGLGSSRLDARRVLGFAPLLMVATGLGFAWIDSVILLLGVAFIGTLNPSGGDVSIFLPAEQALLATAIAPGERTRVFARYALVGSSCAALGSLVSTLPERVAVSLAVPFERAFTPTYLFYAAMGGVLFLLYAPLRRAQPGIAAGMPSQPKLRAPVRPVVFRLAALFCLDSFGSGFVVQSLLALWLLSRFGVSLQVTGAILFGGGLLAAFSQLASAPLARRFGLVPTMVFSHIPANLCLMGVALAPNVYVAVTLLFARFALSSMDVPARQALVMGLVPPEERTSAAAITNVPRSLAAALSPLLAGALLGVGHFHWALLLGGGLKVIYDLLLLAQSRKLEQHQRLVSR